VSIHELRGDKIARETIYVAEGWEPPAWRSVEVRTLVVGR
jgi:hypothetical protein